VLSHSLALDVLLINKYFYPLAGAETAFLHTRDLLRSRGHRVIDFTMDDPQNLPSEQASYFAPRRSYDSSTGVARRAWDAVNALYSVSARRALGRLLDVEKPAVAHIHNIYHQLTLSIVDELHARGIPIVQTLHDYKIACPAYTLFTEGAPCRRCVGRSTIHAVRHRCVKGSLPASALAAAEASIARRRGTYQRVAFFIAPSRFAGSIAMAAGIPEQRVRFLPYFLPDDELVEPSSAARPPTFFFGGRLAETKGVRQLLTAFEQVPAPARLKVAGWGPLEAEVQAAAERNSRVEYLGSVPRSDVLSELARSRALLLPSTWEDNCPLVMLEARARATPVIASDRGGPPEFVRDGVDGFVVDPDDIGALSERIRRLAEDESMAEEFGRLGRERLLLHHRADSHYAQLLEIYEQATARPR
jgi:glycosyltransferase involved in cell wall biosynthesis